MRRSVNGLVVFAAGVLVGLAASSPRAFEQESQKLADATFGHVGIIVPDVEASARVFAEAFGVDVPKVTEFSGVLPFAADYRGDRNAHPKYTHLNLKTLNIELLEPVGGPSPWRDQLERHGRSLHHIQLSVPDPAATMGRLEKLGGKILFGGPGTGRGGYIDLTEPLGFTMEVSQSPR